MPVTQFTTATRLHKSYNCSPTLAEYLSISLAIGQSRRTVATLRLYQESLARRKGENFGPVGGGKRVMRRFLFMASGPAIVIEHDNSAAGHLRPKLFERAFL